MWEKTTTMLIFHAHKGTRAKESLRSCSHQGLAHAHHKRWIQITTLKIHVVHILEVRRNLGHYMQPKRSNNYILVPQGPVILRKSTERDLFLCFLNFINFSTIWILYWRCGHSDDFTRWLQHLNTQHKNMDSKQSLKKGKQNIKINRCQKDFTPKQTKTCVR